MLKWNILFEKGGRISGHQAVLLVPRAIFPLCVCRTIQGSLHSQSRVSQVALRGNSDCEPKGDSKLPSKEKEVELFYVTCDPTRRHDFALH